MDHFVKIGKRKVEILAIASIPRENAHQLDAVLIRGGAYDAAYRWLALNDSFRELFQAHTRASAIEQMQDRHPAAVINFENFAQ